MLENQTLSRDAVMGFVIRSYKRCKFSKSSRSQMFLKISVLQNFAIFKENTVLESLFIDVAGLNLLRGSAALLERDSA